MNDNFTTATDPTPLQESIARAIYAANGPRHILPDDLDDAPGGLREHVRAQAAAALPLVRAAQADAWDEGSGGRDDLRPNPYRAPDGSVTPDVAK